MTIHDIDREIDDAVRRILDGIEDRPHRVQRSIVELAEHVEGIKDQKWVPEARRREISNMFVLVERVEQYERDAAALFDALEDEGFYVDEIQHLRAPGIADARAVPILLDYLGKTNNIWVKFDILQALASDWAYPEVIEPLFGQLDQVRDAGRDGERMREAILGCIVNHPVAPWRAEFVRIATDRKYGLSRYIAVIALARSRSNRDELIPLMEGLLLDEQPLVAGRAARNLGNWKVKAAAAPLEERLKLELAGSEPDSDLVSELRSALRKLTKQ